MGGRRLFKLVNVCEGKMSVRKIRPTKAKKKKEKIPKFLYINKKTFSLIANYIENKPNPNIITLNKTLSLLL